MTSAADHEALAVALVDCSAAAVVSGYHCELYDRLYADWCAVEIAASTGNAAVGRQRRVEVLWSNRPLTRQLQLPLAG